MDASKKILYSIGIFGLIVLVSLAVFSACDNRKAVNPKLDVNQTVTMSLSPVNLVIHSLEKPDTVNITLRVRDANGTGIDSIEVELNRYPEVGTIVAPGLTAMGGYASAQYITDLGVQDDTQITLIASSGKATDTTVLQITVSLATVSMTLMKQPLIIHSQHNPDTVEIDIRVRDGDGNGIDSAAVELTRTPEVGTIVPPGLTSMGGYAGALYITDPGMTEDMQVTFTTTSGSAVDIDVLDVLVSLQGEIDTMNISLGKHTLVADGSDNTNVYVSVIDTTGVPISDGTVVYMENWGAGFTGTLDSTFSFTNNGVAVFELTAPPFIDTIAIVDSDSLVASGESESGAWKYARTAITYIPDQADMLEIVTIPVEMVSGSGEYQEIRVRVTDSHGSFVRNGTQVRFKNQMISSDITSLTTTLGGYATGIYTVGTESGLDIVQAFITTPGTTDTLWSDAVPLTIRSSEPTNIVLSTSDPTIEVGGIATMIYATMQDENSNPLSDGFEILFEITAAPSMVGTASPSFNHVPTEDSVTHQAVEVTNVNGRAAVALFSGTKAGTVRIKATSVLDANIFKEKPLITIQSGPPYVIDIFPSNVAEVSDQAIISGITAAVWDQYTNPVEPLTAVHFEVTPDTIAYIEGAAYTGGWIDSSSGSPDTIGVRGLATTWMAYSCYHTFDTIRVVASSGDMEDTSLAIVLAIYEGDIAVNPTPGVLYLDPTGPDTVAYADVEAQLLDGLGCPIENGVINFTVEVCGTISGPYSDTTDVTGFAYTEFKILYWQLPADPTGVPPHCAAKVVARLRGYPDVDGENDIYCNANN